MGAFGSLYFRLTGRKVDFPDGAAWANLNAFAARLALGRVDVGEVASHFDGLERAGLEALLAGNAANFATLHRNGAFVGVRAADIDTTVVLATRADFEQTARAGLDTGSASYALVRIHRRKPGDGV